VTTRGEGGSAHDTRPAETILAVSDEDPQAPHPRQAILNMVNGCRRRPDAHGADKCFRRLAGIPSWRNVFAGSHLRKVGLRSRLFRSMVARSALTRLPEPFHSPSDLYLGCYHYLAISDLSKSLIWQCCCPSTSVWARYAAAPHLPVRSRRLCRPPSSLWRRVCPRPRGAPPRRGPRQSQC
jgi:hypothetical protein